MDTNSEKSQLYILVELLFIPMTFYTLIQFDKIDTWQRGVLWFIVFALIQNEYLSIKTSKAKYNIGLYLLDLLSLLVYLFALKALAKSHPIIGYDPWFWIYLSILWFGYAIWDWIMVYYAESSEDEKNYKRWRNSMFICFSLSLLCGIGLLSMQPTAPLNKVVINILQLLPLSCVVWALCVWWIEALFAKLMKKQLGAE